jgi:hypothetical protein
VIPPAALHVSYSDEGIAIASFHSVTITVLAEPSTPSRLAHLRRHLERHRQGHPEGTYSLTVLGPGSMVVSVPAEIREESTRIARDFPSRGSTIVVEGSGFAGAAIRAFLSGLFLVARNRSQIHATVPEAASWLAPKLPRQDPPLSTLDLVDAVEASRASIRPAR